MCDIIGARRVRLRLGAAEVRSGDEGDNGDRRDGDNDKQALEFDGAAGRVSALCGA